VTVPIPAATCRSGLGWQDSLVGPPGVLAAFLWGLGEATFFFVIPDVLLSFVAILAWPRPRISRRGWLSMLRGSVSGTPYKLYALESPKFTSQPEFLLATPPASAVRFLLLWAGFGGAASGLKTRRGWPFSRLFKVHATLWIASYAFYWGRILFA